MGADVPGLRLHGGAARGAVELPPQGGPDYEPIVLGAMTESSFAAVDTLTGPVSF